MVAAAVKAVAVAGVAVLLRVEVTPAELRRIRRELMAIRERDITPPFGEPLQAHIEGEWPRHDIRFTARQSAIEPRWARIGSRPFSTRRLTIPA